MLEYNTIIQLLCAAVVLTVFGYQLYFLPQRKPIREVNIGQISWLDRQIDFSPRWVWVYSGLYYPFVFSPTFLIGSVAEFITIVSSFYFMLVLHVIISFWYPVRTPYGWREYPVKNLSDHFLKFVQKIDKGGNCFPSMHVAVASLAAFHLTTLGYSLFGISIAAIWLVPALISYSALATKQHVFSDLMPGFLLATCCFVIYQIAIHQLHYLEFMQSMF